MKTAGIIGGIGPESTIVYYRTIVARYRERTGDGSYPPILINSIDLKKTLDWIGAGRLPEVTEYLLGEVERLARAGADFGALAANTPHVVFDSLQRQSSIPLVSIVQVACRAAQALGLKRAGLFGTRFTMQARFYPDVFVPAGIALVLPSGEEQEYIHTRYIGELLNGVVLPETRAALIAIVERMRVQQGIEGLLLGGTELSLILTEGTDAGVPILDTTRLHAEEIVTEMLEMLR